jgi:hypothetical protein
MKGIGSDPRLFAPHEPGGPDMPVPDIVPLEYDHCERVIKGMHAENLTVSVASVAEELAQETGRDVQSFHIFETIRRDTAHRKEWVALFGRRTNDQLRAYEQILPYLQKVAASPDKRTTYGELFAQMKRDGATKAGTVSSIRSYFGNHPGLPSSLGVTVVTSTSSGEGTVKEEKIEFRLSAKPWNQLGELASFMRTQFGISPSETEKTDTDATSERKTNTHMTVKEIADKIALGPTNMTPVSEDFIRAQLERMRRERAADYNELSGFISDL